MSASSKGPFPPRIGWIPLAVAVAIVLGLSAVAIVPQYSKKDISTVAGGQNASGDSTDSGSGGTADASNGGTTAGTQGSAGQTIYVNGKAVTKGGSRGPAAGTHGTSGGGAAGGTAGGSAGASGGAGGDGGSGGGAGSAACAAGQNGGNTAPGVTSTEINIATTDVTTGTGSSFLKEATQGMQAAINEVNSAGGICGRHVVLQAPVNSGWDRSAGSAAINQFISSGNVFALVGEPDSEGLAGAIDSGSIDRAQIPVVGTDGMLSDQYKDPWVWPVAASTVSNMHIIAKHAVDQGYNTFGIVYDQKYKFGAEGAAAFAAELKRLGKSIDTSGCSSGYCGISPDDQSGGYTSEITAFDQACGPCDVVVLLLEPSLAQTWMQNESGSWFRHLSGGEPLFDDTYAGTCASACDKMDVWTGYKPAIQPFNGAGTAVATYTQSLKQQCQSCDAHNEFTEGAYLGTKLFLEACKRAGPDLTRPALQQTLNAQTFDFGLSVPLSYGSSHIANASMAQFAYNAVGHGWNYENTNYIDDPAKGQDMAS